jgi:tyrosine-protein kinase
VLTIYAQDGDPARAAAIANAIAGQLVSTSSLLQGRQTSLQESIDAELKATQDEINTTEADVQRLVNLHSPGTADAATLLDLQDRLATLRSTYAALLSSSTADVPNLLSVVEPAAAPIAPVSPQPLLDTLIAAVVGLLVAVGAISVIEYLDDTVTDSDVLQEITNLAALGSVEQMRGGGPTSERYRVVSLFSSRSQVAEAYRTLRTNIEFASVDAPLRTLLVTSTGPSEGKTVTAANLAVVFAQAGRRVLLVDADLRKPGIHLIFDLPNSRGFTTLIRSDEVSMDTVLIGTEQQNLSIITTGPLPPNPGELLSSQRVREVVDRLKLKADLVIFDSPPLQAVTDAAILSSYLDATLLVIQAHHTRRDAVRRSWKELDNAGATVLGAVLNRTPKTAPSNSTGYYADDYAFASAVAGLARNAKEGAGTQTEGKRGRWPVHLSLRQRRDVGRTHPALDAGLRGIPDEGRSLDESGGAATHPLEPPQR